MGKKITRQTVLGTIVGGLTVAPFVIRSRWKQEGIGYSFAEKWKQALAIGAEWQRTNPFGIQVTLCSTTV